VVSGNSAADVVEIGGAGGGIVNMGVLTVLRSTISGNDAGFIGGGVFNGGTLTMLNSTVSGNDAEEGGGVVNNGGTTTLNSTTITNNYALHVLGGGVWNTGGGTLRVSNTIIARNNPGGDGPSNCDGTLTSRGYNLFGSTCTVAGDRTGNKVAADPKLGPLQNNGGPTPTHALLPGSPAINAGNPARPGSGDPACPPNDQRLRPRGATRCDIGALEVQ
ncbi:MAG: hypothetical protein M3336_17560, partial [Chloroflexota bacterium]|nr:hypothetical protein [Chloroflexota bacterium]